MNIRATALAALADRHRVLRDAIVLVLITAVIATIYVWTKAPLYNPMGSIDPWLYTALWMNFEQIYHHFITTYYVSRIPWIVPGYLLNLAFGQVAAYFIVHTVFFFVGAVLFYVLCRRWLGSVAAATAYAGLIGNQLYFNAHRWDYEVGGALTYVIAAIAFAAPKTVAGRARTVSLVLSGFFAAAAVTTLIVDALYIAIGLPLVYAAAFWGRADRRRLGMDAVAFGVGALLLVFAGGLFARAHGGEFLFFRAQIRAARATKGEAFQQPFNHWIGAEPYFFLPIFVTGVGLITLLIMWRASGVERRFLLAGTAWTATAFGIVAAWEFLGSGFLFEYSYYFNAFLVPMLFTLAAVVATIEKRIPPCWIYAAVAVAATVAVTALPEAWIYVRDNVGRVAHGFSSSPYIAALAAMAVVLVCFFFARARAGPAILLAAVMLGFFSVAYTSDASYDTYVEGYSDAQTGYVYRLGSDMIKYLRAHGFESQIPFFWFNGTYHRHLFYGLQSLYYSGFTYIGTTLPTINADFRSRIGLFRPDRLVLLCASSHCANAVAALRQAGFRPKPKAHGHLVEGSVGIWIEIYGIAGPRT
jgi:hypothetical protein